MADSARVSPPTSLTLTANRLRLHLLEWGGGGRVVLLLHGFLEHAHAWDFLAPHLARAGLHVYALDWRGHGDSQWVGAGGYYHFFDYVADLADAVPQLGEQVSLIAHSMGGGAAVLYAGTEPQRVRALVLIEGLGVPDAQHPGDRGQRLWKFDPLHQTRSPLPTPVAWARAFWQRVACPVLYVEGAESLLRLSEADLGERLTALRARRIAIPGAAHHPHLEQPERLAAVVLEFLGNT